MKRILLISSLLMITLNALAVDRSVICMRYGLQPGSVDFTRCLGNSQTPNVASPVGKTAPKPANKVDPPSPTQTDIGKLVVVYRPDADAYYPSFSKRSGEQGAVVVRLIIDETGSVEDVAILQSSTFPRLDRAATEIGKQYHFKPFLVNGSPQRISTNLLIKFNLKDN